MNFRCHRWLSNTLFFNRTTKTPHIICILLVPISKKKSYISNHFFYNCLIKIPIVRNKTCTECFYKYINDDSVKSFKVATWLWSLSSKPLSLIAPIVETSKTGEIFLPMGDFFEWRNVPLDYIFNLEKFVTWMLSGVYFLLPYIYIYIYTYIYIHIYIYICIYI